MARASFHTLGCKLNFSETATIAREFSTRDFEIVPFGQPADVIVINTCTVTDKAEQKCRNAVRRGTRSGGRPFVVVTGCYAQLRPEEIAAIPGVDLVLGMREKFELFELVESFTHGESTQVEVSCIDEVVDFGPAYSASERTRAFLKVQDGCDYSCSFCTIPMARGRSRSAHPTDLLHQAEEIAAQGFREIVLSGVNVGLYGQEFGTDLLALLHLLDEVDGIDRYRISSIEPNLLTEEIVSFVSASDRFVPHFHIPLQSGSDEVLAGMRRRYKPDVYRRRVNSILNKMPDACIGADVIVGFPGESDDLFAETVTFLDALPVSYLHVFTYSERPGTVAAERTENGVLEAVPHTERSRRNRVLRRLSSRKRKAFYDRFAGNRRTVLWESGQAEDTLQGFTDNYIRVRGAAENREVGTIEEVIVGRIAADGIVDVDEHVPLPILEAHSS
ncbi:MAG: tRNA (N(6)-L-threonylcarbamoyladenosine(37)-C(2))-methylthiotransferase MtaB [Rhodothermales bacterium]